MKTSIFYFKLLVGAILTLSIFVQNTYSNPYHEKCFQKYKEIQQDCLFYTIEKKVKVWDGFKDICSQHGIYEHYKAMFYVMDGDAPKVIETLQQSLINLNYDIRANATLLATILYSQGDYEETKKWADILIQKYPNDFNGYALLGEYYIQYHNWDLAKQNLENAYRLNNTLPGIQASLSAVYYQYDRCEEVVELYYDAYKTAPCVIISLRLPTVSMIASLTHLGRLEEAQRLLNEQLEKDPSSKDFYGHQVVKQELEKQLAARRTSVKN